MKKTIVCPAILFFALSVGVVKGYSQANPLTKIEDLQKSAAAFSENMAESLPFNASLGLNWSDAYIGKVFPSAPPHFGIGGSFGITTMKMGSMKEITKALGFDDMPDIDSLIFPAYTAEVRIGGIVLPFDIGLKFGTLPSISLPLTSIEFEYTLFGIDARYAILEGNLALPKISLGVGYYYLDGGIWASAGNSMNISAGPNEFNIASPKIGLLWNTSVLELKAQISKQFLVITPYAGFGLGYAWSEVGYEVKTKLTYADGTSKDDITAYLKEKEIQGINIDDNGFSSMISASGMGVRAFGGFSLNVAVLKFDLTMMYNFLDQNWGGSLGARVQL